MLIGLTAGLAAGCGSSSPATAGPFISCAASGLAVPGGQIEVLSVDGAGCQTAAGVMSAVMVRLDDAKATSSGPKLVEGWNCVTYEGSQATCIRGHTMLYAQYTLP